LCGVTEMDSEFVDVIVIGLGPAGARAAEAAARAGCDVIALERRAEPGLPVQCAEFVPSLIGQELDGIVVRSREGITSMATYVERDEPDNSPDFKGQIIDRDDFDRALVDRAKSVGADCRFGTRVVAVGGDGEVKTASGENFRSCVLIGADGPRSVLGAAIGARNVELVETRQIRVPLLKPFQATDVWLSSAYPGGYAWLFPKGDVANLGLGVAAPWKSVLKPELAKLHRALIAEGRVGAEILGHIGGAIPVNGVVGPVGQLREIPVMLAGDAAGLTHPISGAGIAAAVMSGHLAGEAAAAWQWQDKDALDDYRDELHCLFDRALRRASDRRHAVLRQFEVGDGPDASALRRSWIAYPEYWAT